MRVERPAASTTRGDRAARVGRRLRARLRPRDDLHQQAADAHAGDVLARHRQARRAAASAPSRSRSPWASARSPARRAPAARAPSPISSRLPGSTGMPKCSMRPPTASTRGRNDVAAVGDRRGAEHHDQLGAVASSTSSSALASARCSCGTRRSATMLAPAGASRSSVTCSVFSITLSARPGSRVETTPTLRIAIGRDADQRLRRRRAAPDRASRASRRPRTE